MNTATFCGVKDLGEVAIAAAEKAEAEARFDQICRANLLWAGFADSMGFGEDDIIGHTCMWLSPTGTQAEFETGAGIILVDFDASRVDSEYKFSIGGKVFETVVELGDILREQ